MAIRTGDHTTRGFVGQPGAFTEELPRPLPHADQSAAKSAQPDISLVILENRAYVTRQHPFTKGDRGEMSIRKRKNSLAAGADPKTSITPFTEAPDAVGRE